VSTRCTLKIESFYRFARAVNFLSSDNERRQRYFGTSEPSYHWEIYHPYAFATKKKNEKGELIYLTKKHVLSSGDYSDDLKDAIRDNAFKLNTTAAVMFVMDSTCEKTDAARHVGGLKRNMIAVPPTLEALQAWAMARDKRYQKRLRVVNKQADPYDWLEFKNRPKTQKPNKHRQNHGPTLRHLIK
jgi:hypothetical protein